MCIIVRIIKRVVDTLLPLSWKSLFVRLSLMIMMILSVLGLAWEKIEGYVNN